MASLWVRACCAWGEVVLAGLIAIVAGTTAWADSTRALPDVPRFKFFVSSHSTAAAEVITYWATRKAAGIGEEALRPIRQAQGGLGSELALSNAKGSTSSYPTQWGVKQGLPEVVLIGGLEGRIYRCDCGKDIHLWEVAEGTRLWAAAEGLKVKTEARVLRAATGCGPLTSGSPSPGADPPLATPPTAAPLDFDYYRQAIDTGRPVILTYSLDEASAKGMEASFRSQDRVSVVGIGYGDGNPDRHVIALLPQDWAKEKRFERLMALPGVRPGDREGRLLIPWDMQTGNVIATLVEVPD